MEYDWKKTGKRQLLIIRDEAGVEVFRSKPHRSRIDCLKEARNWLDQTADVA